ncbi:MAG: hypothetical protein WC768_01170 [Patescibacteria group bacterium]|jgi:hypothetical protein
MNKTLYLWDLAGTIFYEVWDKEKTGWPNYDAWVAAQLGKKISEVSDREYEETYQIPYEKGWYFQLKLQPGAKEALILAKHNEAFTTGVPEQMDWRAAYLVPKTGFDFRKYFQKINTTFDYGETNKKTEEMLVGYLQKKYQQGYKTVVYTDDKLTNCQMFIEAVKLVQKKYLGFSRRIYHILNNNSGLAKKADWWQIGNLKDLLANEKKFK